MINVYEFLRYQPELYKQLVCQDLLFVYYYCPQTIQKVDVFSHYNILSFIIEGRKLIHRPEQTMLLETGQCYFFKKGAFNQELYMEESWRSMNIYIPDSYFQEFIKAYQRDDKPTFKAPESLGQVSELIVNEPIRQFLHTVLDSFDQIPIPTEAILEGNFKNLFHAVLDQPENQALTSYLSKMTKSSATQSLYSLMEANYMYNLELKEYAQLAHLSLPTFKRGFKSIFNTSPAHWLVQRRLSHAEALLKTTEKSINAIVEESGFESGSHFSRVFKAKFGISPLHYRNQHSNKSLQLI